MDASRFILLISLLLTLELSPADGWRRRRRRRRTPPPPPPPPPCGGNLLNGLQNARVTSSYIPNSQYSHGTTIQFACNGGYTYQSGHSARTCSLGSWNGIPLKCANINECLGLHGCQYYCTDTAGSYSCSCPARWKLDSNLRACRAPECTSPGAPAHGSFLPVQSRYSNGNTVVFTCNGGYKRRGSSVIACDAGVWSPPRPTCVDVDECATLRHGCQHRCANTQGSFTCSCNSGYRLALDRSSCEPTCDGKRECRHGGVCVAPNTCSCQTGWTGPICETAVCSEECVHGRCLSPDVCVCETGWGGSRCDDPICGRECLNGGTCVAPSLCSCPSKDYTGERCEIRVCDLFSPPNNGLTSCAVANSQQTCTVFCQEGYGFAVPPDNPQVCGENGKWTYQHELDVPPHCSRADEADLFGIIRTEFEYEGECDDLTEADKQEIKELALSNLMARICRNRCEGFRVDVSQLTCGELIDDDDGGLFPFRKRQALSFSSIRIDLKFTVDNINSFTVNATNQSEIESQITEKIEQIVSTVSSVLSTEPMQLSLDNGMKSLTGIPGKVAYTPPTKRCTKPGQTLKGLICLNCPPGSYLDNQNGDCYPCPVGTYQDQEAADHCVPCPYNEYQPRRGQTACLACTNGTFTSRLGSTHSSNCSSRYCKDTNCLNGLLCDECRCVELYSVCNSQRDCKDGSDESGCAICNRTCSYQPLDHSHICNTEYALWIKINKISPHPQETVLHCTIVSLPYLQHNKVPLVSKNILLDRTTQACHCFQLSVGRQYFVTIHSADNGSLTLTDDSIVTEWSVDLKREIISLGTCPE